MAQRNGADITELEENIEYIKLTLTVAIQNLSTAVERLTMSVDRATALWEKAVPIRLVIILVMLIALAFGGNRILAIFEHMTP